MATSVYHISVGGKYPGVLSNLRKAVPDIHLPYLISVILAQYNIVKPWQFNLFVHCTKKKPSFYFDPFLLKKDTSFFCFLNRAS